jgi:uncharacterized protein YerC
MRVRPHELNENERRRTNEILYSAVSSLEDKEAMKDFLRDLLTENERIMLGRRILIARALLKGKTFDEIVSKYKVGKDTIHKVATWLDDQVPGYERTVKEVEKELKEQQKKDNKDAQKFDRHLYATSALYRLKKKYPMHFLFFPMPKNKNEWEID